MTPYKRQEAILLQAVLDAERKRREPWDDLLNKFLEVWSKLLWFDAAVAIRNGESADDCEKWIKRMAERVVFAFKDLGKREADTLKMVEMAYNQPSDSDVHKWALMMLAAWENGYDGGGANGGC